MYELECYFLLLFKFLWNAGVVTLAIALTIALNVFLWGSVIAGVLVLIFAPQLLIFPMLLTSKCVKLTL